MKLTPHEPKGIPTLEQTVERMKRQVLEDMEQGVMPLYVKTFSDLHDHVDANEYGGFCEEDFANQLIEHFGGRDENEGMPDGMLDYISTAQNDIDAWLRKRNGIPSNWQLMAVVKKATEDALDAGCATIQEALGIKAGDQAGIWWSGPHEHVVSELLEAYAQSELKLLREESDE